MEVSVIQSLFQWMSEHIFAVIYLFAAVEVFLVLALHRKIKDHEGVLLDISDNLLKGFRDSPDRDSLQNTHERIQGTLEFITQKMAQFPQSRAEFAKNANKLTQKNLYNRHYTIEIYASIMSTIVQIFPLLGILGTILAIAQNAFQESGGLAADTLSQAFVLAMDTTILGITFSIIFMVIESSYWPKIERVINESQECKKIITKLNLL